MIQTPLQFLENELLEVANLFGENINIRHLFKESDNKIINTVIVDGKSYAFGNLMPKYEGELERKRYIKRYAKLAVYKALSALYNKNLPWGALTGIRPTKLAYSELEEYGEFKEFFMDTMKVSSKKTNLVERIISNQKGIYKREDGLTDFFVFIPFCPSRCKYCSFICTDVKSSEKYIDEYVDTLVDEIRASIPFVKNLRSIYIGGGTPVSIGVKRLEKILCVLDEINQGVEYTVEAGRSDVIDEEVVDCLNRHNVTRICINPQTFNDKTLELIGRKHTEIDTIRAFNLVKDKFIVNMDLIAGLPGESFEDFKYSLDKAISLSPENITVHTLCIKRGSELSEKYTRLPEGEVEKMVDYSSETLEGNGYSPYYMYRQKYMAGNLENVGYCKENTACIYNIDIMEEIASIIGCGANAISKRVFTSEDRIERVPAPKDVKTYLEKVGKILIDKQALFK